MKNLYKYLLILLVISSACDKVFHEEDNEYIVLDKTQEKIDVVKGINALLAKVHNQHYLKLLTRSDDLFEYRTRHWRPEEEYEIVNIKDAIYKNLYTAIISANSAIEQSNEGSEAHIKGELYFLRAYCYFKLTRLFGTPPLVKGVDVDYTLKKPTYANIYEFIESDLLKATNLLPKNTSEARIPYETPISDAAKSLLAELYLSWAGYPAKDESKYAQAAKYSGEVLQNSSYVLLDDLANLWKENNKHNAENIFSLSYKYEEIEINNHHSIPNEDCLNNFLSASVSPRDLAGHNVFEFSGTYFPKLKFYDRYPKNYRKEVSFNIGDFYLASDAMFDSNPITSIRYYVYDPFHERTPRWEAIVPLKSFDKEALVDLLESIEYGTTVPLYLIRYASTILTYAEAKARIGELDASAYEAINSIRRRANKVDLNTPSEFDLKPGLSQEQFIDSVVWERAWELCFEPDGRWFDIVRLDLKEKLNEYILPRDYYLVTARKYLYELLPDERFYEIPDNCISSDWYFFAIPQKDIWLNPNLKEEK